MTEQELRVLVREVIARSAAERAGAGAGGGRTAPVVPASMPMTVAGESSHALFTLPPGDPDGRCIIEPAVACNHCGYCKSYGH
jgi:hypothetical protein